MTIETDLDDATLGVSNRKEKVVSSKRQLTAYVSDSLSFRNQAEDAASATLSVRDQASGFATLSGTAATNSVGATSFSNLSAIAESKGVTAVDVFVYDTSLDSDGGAWRYRTTGTSWYKEELNTATRGSRREFPAVAVIVAETDKVTIYDGDDPALPMWMVFLKGGTTAERNIIGQGADLLGRGLKALNGLLVSATTTRGIRIASFVEDAGYLIDVYEFAKYKSSVANRNANSGFVTLDPAKELASNDVNDVAMTVLSDAPIDAATGLPVPTIAVATDGGVSVLKDDGTVVDIVHFYTNTLSVEFYAGGVLFNGRNNTLTIGAYCFYPSIPDTDLSHPISGLVTFSDSTVPALNTIGSRKIGDPIPLSDSAFVVGDLSNTVSSGLSTVAQDLTSTASSMVAYTTSTYNTGWMNGDIKGAFLSDTYDTDLVDSGELVTNGDVWGGASGTTPPNNWTVPLSSTDSSYSVSSGVLSLINGTGSTRTVIRQPISVVVGNTYEVQVAGLTNGDAGGVGTASVRVTDSDNYADVTPVVIDTSNQNIKHIFTATTSTVWVFFINLSTLNNVFVSVDNISVRPADADRSHNNNVLTVNGTITRSPVAEGAELVAYSGFSATNYLEQPYNSDLDFGTGDFCMMGWMKTTDGYGRIMYRSDADGSPSYSMLVTARNIAFSTYDGISSQIIGREVTNGQWTHFVGVRHSSGLMELYVNGVLDTSSTLTVRNMDSVDGAATLKIGQAGNNPLTGSLALLRISATAPTEDQIKKIYEDERHLFQPGAQCTLYGTSDSVTALSHDPATNLLHVGTSSGRSVFDGLVRVDNTTTPVGTAISAVNGFVVEE